MIFEAKDRILFIGDSIGDYNRARPYADSVNTWGTSYVAVIAQLLQATYPEKLFHVYNVCVGGNQSRDLRARWQTDVLDLAPDWVCMMIGINDVWRQFDAPDRPDLSVGLSDYADNIEAMLSETLPRVKGMVLMTPYFMEQNKSDPMRQTMDLYGAKCRELGEKYGCLTIDTQAVWDEFFSKGLHPHAISWDCIHPGDMGRMVLARAFLKAVGYEW